MTDSIKQISREEENNVAYSFTERQLQARQQSEDLHNKLVARGLLVYETDPQAIAREKERQERLRKDPTLTPDDLAFLDRVVANAESGKPITIYKDL